MKAVKTVNPKSSHHKGNIFSISLILYLHEMTDDHQTYQGDHFMMCVSQTIMLYTLNLYSTVCQLYLNKTGIKIYLKNLLVSLPHRSWTSGKRVCELFSPFQTAQRSLMRSQQPIRRRLRSVWLEAHHFSAVTGILSCC